TKCLCQPCIVCRRFLLNHLFISPLSTPPPFSPPSATVSLSKDRGDNKATMVDNRINCLVVASLAAGHVPRVWSRLGIMNRREIKPLLLPRLVSYRTISLDTTREKYNDFTKRGHKS
ncbi:unnamed protein product, partial [Candidula unifasciata]